jgi:hypothetical protein
MKLKIRQIVIMLTVIALAVPLAAQATVVGHFTMVQGQVDLLKQGKLPAVAAKLQDAVSPGDIIRTKSRSKAQLTMVDDSVITLAPKSRLAVADYQYNAARGERRAVMRVFSGLVHTVVKRIIQREEPDFIMESHTAIIGVRGTNFYALLQPNSTGVFLPQGTLGVTSNLPTIPALLILESGYFTEVPLGKQPMLPKPITPDMLQNLRMMMNTGVMPVGPQEFSSGGENVPLELPVNPAQMQRLRQVTIPPKVMPTPQVAPPPPPPPPPSPHPSPSPPGPSGSMF